MTVKRLGTPQTVTVYEAVEEILTSGTSWTVPAGVTSIDMVVCIAGGDGGEGGVAAGATNTNAISGGSGGIGGAIATFFRLPVSGTVSYQIGAGGSGGTGGIAATGTARNFPSNPGSGGSTWFSENGFAADSTATWDSASGAMAKRSNGLSAAEIPVGIGGLSGSTSTNGAGGAGLLYYPSRDTNGNITSTNRAALTYISTGGGGGGTGASSTASVQYGRPAGGGSNTAGGTGGAVGGQPTNIGLNGGNASGYGSGGGGAASVKVNGVAAGNGGSGSNGAIILRYTKATTVSLRGGAVQ